MSEKEKLVKQINKLIFGKIIEISIVIILVGLSIPAWNVFAAKMGDVNIIKMEDCKLNYKERKENNIDFLTIENNFAFNKNYKVYLEINKNIPLETEIIINNKEYILNDFYKIEVGNNNKFTLLDKNIVASIDTYNIKINSAENNQGYKYIFEEINDF